MRAADESVCPVCRASFRGRSICSRCGADLARLMAVAARAFVLRQRARCALRAGQVGTAHDLAGQAQVLHRTCQGERLLAVTRILEAVAALSDPMPQTDSQVPAGGLQPHDRVETHADPTLPDVWGNQGLDLRFLCRLPKNPLDSTPRLML